MCANHSTTGRVAGGLRVHAWRKRRPSVRTHLNIIQPKILEPMVCSEAIDDRNAERTGIFFGARLRALAVLTVGLFSIVSCRQAEPVVALIAPTTGVPLWDAVHAGAVDEAEHGPCRIHVRYDAPPQEDNLRAQIDLFERSRESGAVAIIIAPSQPLALRNPLERAAAAGLPVVLLEEDLGFRNGNLGMVLNDDALGARLAADAMAKALHGKGSIAILGVDVSRSSSLIRERAFEQEFAEHYPAIRVTQRRLGTSNLAREQQSAGEILDSPSQIDGLIAMTSTSTRGAYYAVLNHGLMGKVHIIGFDQDLIQPVRTGEIDGIVAQRSYDIGVDAVRSVCERLQGKRPNQMVEIAPLLVTKDNYTSPEVAREFNLTWWDDRGE